MRIDSKNNVLPFFICLLSLRPCFMTKLGRMIQCKNYDFIPLMPSQKVTLKIMCVYTKLLFLSCRE